MVDRSISEAEFQKKIIGENKYEEVSPGVYARRKDDEEPEPKAEPEETPVVSGQMQAAEKSAKKQAGQMGAWKSRKGYYAKGPEDTGEEPSILKKVVSVGKKAAKIVGEKVSEFGKNEIEADKLQKKHIPMPKGSTDEDAGEEEKEIIKPSHTVKGTWLSGGGSYKTAFTSGFGKSTYESAYKPRFGGEIETEDLIKGGKKSKGKFSELMVKGGKKSKIDELTPREEEPEEREPDRFNTQNWQSLGFPNTLPESERGALFRPAPPIKPSEKQVILQAPKRVVAPPKIVPPKKPQPAPRVAQPMPRMTHNIGTQIPHIGGPMMGGNLPHVATPAAKRTQPMELPKIGSGLMSTAPKQKAPQKTSTPAAPMTFMGHTLSGKKKEKTPKKKIEAAPIMIFGVPVYKKK